MKKIEKLLCISLVVLTCIASIPLQGLMGADINYTGLFAVNAQAVSDSGTCGKNAKWKYDRNTKTLTVYGKGSMYDYDPYNGIETPYFDKETYPIKNVVISDGITRVGNSAFDYLYEESDITSVKIADSVTSIGQGAFAGAKIKEIALPKKLKKIEKAAFSGCKKLKKVTVPDSVTVIEEWAFEYCSSLEELNLGNGVKKVHDVYGGCEKLAKVTFGKNVKSFKFELMNYGNNAAPISVHKDNQYFSADKNGVLFNKNKTKLIFYPGKIKLTSYTIPKTVTAIAAEAFYGTENLETVNTSNVKKIGDRAFSTSDIKEVVMGSKLETIGEGAFNYCENLKTVKIPAGVIKIGSEAFSEESEVIVSAKNKKYHSEDGALFNKDKTTLIRYSKNNTAETYTIPETVTKISVGAFSKNDYLVNVNFPENLKTIGAGAFYSCDGLESVSLSKNISSIGEDAFSYCKALKKVSIAEGSTAVIKSWAFSDCEELDDIYISSKIYKVGEGVFISSAAYNKLENSGYNGAYYVGNVLCSVIGEPEKIEIKEGITAIADGALSYQFVKTVTIPASLKYIGKNAFESMGDLTTIKLSKDNKHFIMENGALLTKDKTRLIKYATKSSAKEYKAPDTVRYIDNYAFISGTKLENIDFSSKVNDINITMFMYTPMYENFPKDEVVYYKKHAIDFISEFSYNGFVDIKSGTKSITINEYTDNSMEAIYIPKSVEYIAYLPEDVYYEGSKEDWAKIKFDSKMEHYIDYINVHYNFNKKAKHEHSYYGSYVYPEKCFSNITVKYVCPCGDTRTEKGMLYDDHIYTEKMSIEKYATLKHNGVIYNVCGYCGKKFNKTVIKKIDSVKLSYKNTKYNGKVKTPTVEVIDSDGYKLYEREDYTLKYSSGRKEVGTYYVTVTFKGYYSGTKQLKFNIVPA